MAASNVLAGSQSIDLLMAEFVDETVEEFGEFLRRCSLAKIRLVKHQPHPEAGWLLTAARHDHLRVYRFHWVEPETAEGVADVIAVAGFTPSVGIWTAAGVQAASKFTLK